MTCFKGIRGFTPPWAEWLHSIIIGLGDKGYEIIIERIDDAIRIREDACLLVCRNGKYHFKKNIEIRSISWLLEKLGLLEQTKVINEKGERA